MIKRAQEASKSNFEVSLQVKKPKPPEASISSISSLGLITISFSEPIIVPPEILSLTSDGLLMNDTQDLGRQLESQESTRYQVDIFEV